MLRYIFIFFILQTKAQDNLNKQIEIHGHRGFRGAYPENTITSFKEAVKLGVDAIELDVVISKDSQVVVSHEPWFNYKICSEPDGANVKTRKQHNLYKMDYSEIRKFDCGKRGNKDFLGQKHLPEYKPLLSEVIETMELYCKENKLPPVEYIIEIKCLKPGDDKWHPKPERFAKLVNDVISKYKINDRIYIQSFDTRSLQYFHKLQPDIRIGLLVSNLGSVDHYINKLGFTPYMYNPSLKLIKKSIVMKAQAKGCKVMVWTVNSEKAMKQLIQMGVDGLITDYPDLALKLR